MRPANPSEEQYQVYLDNLKKGKVGGSVDRHATAGRKPTAVTGTLLSRNARGAETTKAPPPQRRELANELLNKLSKGRVELLKTRPWAGASNRTGISTAGYREDIGGQYFRSAWEANYARFLNFSGIKWEYEKKTFWFEKIRRGVRSYTPDFYLIDEKVYHEVKGWMDKKSATKLKRMKTYHPAETVHVIGRDFFRQANKQGLCKLIPHWECRHKKHNGTAQLHLSPEHCAKISAALKGRVFTKETIAKLSCAAKARYSARPE
jgi:hypothetical protein